MALSVVAPVRILEPLDERAAYEVRESTHRGRDAHRLRDLLRSDDARDRHRAERCLPAAPEERSRAESWAALESGGS